MKETEKDQMTAEKGPCGLQPSLFSAPRTEPPWASLGLCLSVQHHGQRQRPQDRKESFDCIVCTLIFLCPIPSLSQICKLSVAAVVTSVWMFSGDCQCNVCIFFVLACVCYVTVKQTVSGSLYSITSFHYLQRTALSLTGF